MADASHRLARNPTMKSADRASSAPNTATANAPPIWRLVLNTPLAVPASAAGTLESNTTATGGATNGPDRPTSTISAAIHAAGVDAGKAATATRPMAMLTRPP